jgi:2-dehydro-3-deoxygalactonokinase
MTGGEALREGDPVYILADPHLGALYATAVMIAGGQPIAIDSHTAFVAGSTVSGKRV